MIADSFALLKDAAAPVTGHHNRSLDTINLILLILLLI